LFLLGQLLVRRACQPLSLSESTTSLPTDGSPPFTPTLRMLPNLSRLSVLRANWWDGCDSRPRYDTHATLPPSRGAPGDALALTRCQNGAAHGPRESVSPSPWRRRRNAPNGFSVEHRLRRISRRQPRHGSSHGTANAILPHVSVNLRP
jgi:hypothetical protein